MIDKNNFWGPINIWNWMKIVGFVLSIINFLNIATINQENMVF